MMREDRSDDADREYSYHVGRSRSSNIHVGAIITGLELGSGLLLSRNEGVLDGLIWIDDFRWATGFVWSVWERAAVDGPTVQDGGDQTDDECAADGRPEP